MKISQASQAILQEHAVAQQRISDLNARSQRLPDLRAELQQARHRMQHLDEEEKLLGSRTREAQDLRTHLHGLEADRSRIGEDIREIAEKLDLLHTEHGATCPLCETELGAEGLRLIEDKYVVEREQKTASLAEAGQELDGGRTALKAAADEVASLEARLKGDRAAAQGKISLLAQQAADAEQAGQQLAEAQTQLTEIEEHLASRDFAAAQQEALASTEKELAELGYDRTQHDDDSRSTSSAPARTRTRSRNGAWSRR